MTARTTTELALALAITPIGEAAGVAPLARVPRVYTNDSDANRLSLVFQKGSQLSERPGVKPALGVAARDSDAGSDVREVFDNHSRSWLNVCQNRPRENMVAIPSEPLRASREVLQVPLGTLRPIGLQLATKAEAAFLHFAPAAFAVKSVVRCHGGSADSEVNAQSLSIILKYHIRTMNDDM